MVFRSQARSRTRVSFNTVLDFIAGGYGQQAQIVSRAHDHHERSKEFDFDPRWYWPLATRIVRAERAGSDLNSIDTWIEGLKPSEPGRPDKRASFRACLEGYRKWRRAHELKIVGEPKPTTWNFADLAIAVQPEFEALIDGRLICVKLYFKAHPLRKRDISPALHLLDLATKRSRDPEATAAILDLRHSRLFEATRLPQMVGEVLEGLLMNFSSLWAGVTARRAGVRPRKLA